MIATSPRVRAAAVAMLLAVAWPVTGVRGAGPAVAAGEYIAEGGVGMLSVSAAQGGMQRFSISAVGANFHVCELGGRIDGRTARVPTDTGEARCEVTFTPGAGRVAIAATPGCRYFCGARAGFEGVYLRPAPACTDRARRATRDAFQRLYDRKRYAEAVDRLAPLPAACARTLGRYERGGLLNDIAIAQYRAGRREACLATLAPLAGEAARSDAQIRDAYPPADADEWLPILQAARHNLGLCRARR